MKILFTVTYYAPYISGLTIHVQRLAEELAKKEHEITVLACQHKKELALKEKVNKINVLRVPYLVKMHKGFIMPKYLQESWEAVNQVDIVVATLPQIESIVPAICAVLQRKKFYCMYLCEVMLPPTLGNRIIQSIMHILHSLVLVCAKKIVTLTEDYAQHTVLLPLFTKKLFYIYPVIPPLTTDRILVRKIQQMINKTLNDSNNNSFVIGIAARFAAEKGIEYLLEAIPMLEKALGKNFRIVFAGPEHPVGEEAYWSQMQPLVDKYRKYLLFVGTLPENSMGSYYANLNVLVLPSVNTTEAFGIVQVEAMSCNVPVVASDLPGVRVPISVTGMGIIVKPRSSTDLARKIVEVVKHPTVYKNRQHEIKKHFSSEKSISQYLKLFNE